MNKIFAMQKIMYKLLFYQQFNTNNRFKETKQKGWLFFIASWIITYIVTVFYVLGSSAGLLYIAAQFIVMNLFTLINTDCFIYHLPNKRNFVILNFYIYTTSSMTLIGIFSCLLFFGFSIPGIISGFFSGDVFEIHIFDSLFISNIITCFYIIIFINGISTSLFAQKAKNRNAIIIIYSAVFNLLALYIHGLIPKNREIGNELVYSIPMITNIWLYVAIMFCITVIVTLGGYYISVFLDKQKDLLKR